MPAIHLRLEDDIRSGAIETHLLRPASYPLLRVAESCGGLLVRQAVLGAIGVAALFALSGHGGAVRPWSALRRALARWADLSAFCCSRWWV